MIIEPKIKEFLEQHDIHLPDEFKNFKEIKFSNKKDTDAVILVYKNGQSTEIRLGRLLKRIFPDLPDKKIEEVAKEFKFLTTMDDIDNEQENKNIVDGYEFYFIDDIFTDFAYHFDNMGFHCCTSGKPDILQFYKLMQPTGMLKEMYMKDIETGEIVGRADCWMKGVNIGKPYIDRFYTTNLDDKGEYERLFNIFKKWCILNNYAYRAKEIAFHQKIFNSSTTNLSFQIPKNVWDNLKLMTYMDTFLFGTNEGLITNYFIEGKTQYVFRNYKTGTDVSNKTKNEKFHYWNGGEWTKDIWYNGYWQNGIWKGGEWMHGIWQDGLWVDGIFRGGWWYNGVWKNGVWVQGTWVKGVWEKGIWKTGRIYSERFNEMLISHVNPVKFKKYEKEAESYEEFLSMIK